jgi:hypothetical protein
VVLTSLQDSVKNSCDDSVAADTEELESHICVCANERIQFLLEQGAGAIEAGLYVFFTDLKAFCSFGRT